MHKKFLFSVLLFSGALGHDGLAAPPKSDAALKAMAAMLVPLPLTPNGGPEGLAQVRARVISIIETMEKSSTKDVIGGETLLNNAYRFRPDVGGAQRVSTVATISAVPARLSRRPVNARGVDERPAQSDHSNRKL